jgi:NAD(P)-dependent dehydrogenase (short-subunit alcohol dehydrogenase family)
MWALADAVHERFGHVDLLVNNVGASPVYPSLVETIEELWHKIMAVNLKGAFRLSALIGTRIAESGGGVIINMSSVGSIAPSAHELPDTRAKAGLNTLAGGLSRALAGVSSLS